MKIIFPPKLKRGDHIRVVAPARSFQLLSDDTVKKAVKRLQNFGFTVSFGKNISECNDFMSSSIKARLSDLHDAFMDNKVNAIFSVVGGYSSNQLLDYIDYNLIKNNPKIFCGFSDITALSNAIFSKTGIVGYSGPHFSSWGIKKGFDYSIDYFQKCCMQREEYVLKPSNVWSDDEWYLDQEKRDFFENEGFWVINKGIAQGTILGGHLPCVNALQGTQYWVNYIKDTILFLEIDEEFSVGVFERGIQSLIQQKNFNFVKGIVIGRFQKKNFISYGTLQKIISSKKELKNIPIIANVDFGHTMPFVTFPIGGSCFIDTEKNEKILILTH